MNKKMFRVAAFSAATLSFLYIMTLDSSRPLKTAEINPLQGAPAPLEINPNALNTQKREIASSLASSAPSVLDDKNNIEPGIRDIKQFRQKVFLNEKERLYKKDLLQNPTFLKTMARWLNNPNTDNDNISFAIDSLIEGLESGSAIAREEIIKLVQDGRIEDPKLATADRETLAGIKAELLHLWSAHENIESSIAQMLPGKVSQKIWANVKAHQNNNHQESLQQIAQNKRTEK